ncbi:hypothetical protein BDW22DRAFT_1394854 [Trametopsis cervina]|nr:hypothetical protein BDW22DRAFT_1394854 [Trametopsis cervina]
MPTPVQVTRWVQRTYPKPSIDLEWLDGCYSWIEDELKLDPVKDIDTILYNVETQLLQSDLSDSMLAGTGLPANVSELDNTTLGRTPILLEIISITEIGHSAFSLQNTRQARIEKADLAGLAEEEGNNEDGTGPSYPRSMLKFELSDGSTVLKAIEYRRIPELELGTTPLGFKVQRFRIYITLICNILYSVAIFVSAQAHYVLNSQIILKDVLIRRGIAFLEPKKVILKGYQTEDRQSLQDADFVRGLRDRLGLNAPDEGEGGPPGDAPAPRIHPNPPEPPRAPAAAVRRTPPPPPVVQRALPRSPLQEVARPPEPSAAGPSHMLHSDDIELPRRRKLPTKPREPSPEASLHSSVQSRYFSAGNEKGKHRGVELSRELRLSPHRQGPVVVPDSEEDEPSPPRKPPVFRGKDAPPLVVHRDTDAAASGNTKVNADSSASSDFEFEFNDEFLSQLDKVEQEAIAATATTAVAGSSRTRDASSVASTATLASSSRPAAVVSSRPPQSRNPSAQPQPLVDLGIIDIDDDEADEKENVPVPTRHVRRRLGHPIASQAAPEEIIEISD